MVKLLPPSHVRDTDLNCQDRKKEGHCRIFDMDADLL
jgi:hypothetical protein